MRRRKMRKGFGKRYSHRKRGVRIKSYGASRGGIRL